MLIVRQMINSKMKYRMANRCAWIHSLCVGVLMLFAMSVQAQTVSEHVDSILKSLKLKEVVVKAKKVRQSGDTISYAASSYISKNDKVLEDLLRKMPGIEVTSSGQIKYNGQWINEFYIEGADMLGNNYGVATKNIDANSIGSVQVIEGHQDVKLLQGVKRGTSSAINIKLKQTVKGLWSSTLSAALGTQPKFSRDLSLNLMNFKRKSQSISVYKTNNTGSDLRQEINTPSDMNSALGVGIMLPNKPSVADIYSYRNDSHCVSINQLRKLDDDRTLAYNVNYLYDKEKQNAYDETSYLMDNGVWKQVNESNDASCKSQFVGGHLSYKLNSTKSYLRNLLTFGASFPKNEGIVNEYMAQKLTGHRVSVDNKLQMNYKKKNDAVAEAAWNLSYKDMKGILDVPKAEISQIVRQQVFNTDATTSLFVVRIPYLMFSMNGMVEAEWQKVSTSLAEQETALAGTMTAWNLGAYLSPKFLLHFGRKMEWTVYMPIGLKQYKMEDEGLEYDRTYFSTKPYSYLSYKPSDRLAFDLTFVAEESMPSALSLMVQKRYLNYRTVTANPNKVEMCRNHTLKFAFSTSYKDVIKMFFSGLTFSYVYAKIGNAIGYDFVGDVIRYLPVGQTANNKTLQLSQTTSKGFFKWNSKVSESITLGTTRAEYFVDGVVHDGRSDYLMANISYIASVARWLSLSTANDYSLSKPYTDGRSNGVKYSVFTNTSSLTLWPCKQFCMMPSVQYYHNNYFSTGRNNVFLNCALEYYLGNTTLSLKCNNLLNSVNFRKMTDSGVTRYMSEYRLRGRSIMLGIRIKII